MYNITCLLLAAAVATRTVGASHCTGYWDFDYENEETEQGMCCYITTDNTATWHEAADECRQNDGHLVEIRTENKYTQVKEIAGNADYGNQKKVLWIGANDILKENEFRWKFSYMDIDTDFTRWCNGSRPPRDTTRNCLALVRYSGCSAKWSMEPRDCSEKHRFLCEKLPLPE